MSISLTPRPVPPGLRNEHPTDANPYAHDWAAEHQDWREWAAEKADPAGDDQDDARYIPRRTEAPAVGEPCWEPDCCGTVEVAAELRPNKEIAARCDAGHARLWIRFPYEGWVAQSYITSQPLKEAS